MPFINDIITSIKYTWWNYIVSSLRLLCAGDKPYASNCGKPKVSQYYNKRCFSFFCVFSLSNPLVLFVCRTLKMPRFPSRSSDSSVSCVWSSCSTVQRASVTCCGPSSSPSRSVTLWSSSFFKCFFPSFLTQWAGLLWFVSTGSSSRSSANRDALLYLRGHRDAGTDFNIYVLD